MGVNGSSDLHPAYTKIMQWSWTKVIAVLREYADGDFDFGIDYSVIVGITGLDLDDAKFIVSNMGKGDGGVVNSVTFLAAVLLLGDANHRNENGRLEALFALMDFNNANQISPDELTILFMCMSSAIVSILDNPEEAPEDAQLVKLGNLINVEKGRKASNPVSKHEFVAFCTEYASKSQVALPTINNVVLLLNGTLVPKVVVVVEEED